MGFQFKPAQKSQAYLRIALEGISGSGKTFNGLDLATALAQGGRVAVIDTERGSASLYSDLWAFDVLELERFSPRDYIDAIRAAEAARYPVILIDSISHEWDFILDLVGGNFNNWKNATPQHNDFVNAILQARAHIIVTWRQETAYSVTDDQGRKGRTKVEKIGTKGKQRQGMEYEFSVVLEIDESHSLRASKTRCPALDGNRYGRGSEVAAVLLRWLSSGAAELAQPQAPAPAPSPRPQAAPPRPLTTDEARGMVERAREWLEKARPSGEAADLTADLLAAQADADIARVEKRAGELPPKVASSLTGLAAAVRALMVAGAWGRGEPPAGESAPEPGSDGDEMFTEPPAAPAPQSEIQQKTQAALAHTAAKAKQRQAEKQHREDLADLVRVGKLGCPEREREALDGVLQAVLAAGTEAGLDAVAAEAKEVGFTEKGRGVVDTLISRHREYLGGGAR